MPGPGRFLFLVCLAMMISPLQAGVYKWVDEQGRVHYGDKPTSNNVEEIKIKEQKKSAQPDLTNRRHDMQQRFLRAREDERNEKKQARAEEKQKQVEAKKKCEQAKKEYDKYRYAGSLYIKGKNNEREHLSFKAREEYEKSLAANIKKWCR